MHNYILEERITELFDSYKTKLPLSQRSWDAIAHSGGLSRNSVYDIIDSTKDVKRETVIALAMALKMNIDDFKTLYDYKGFILRRSLHYEQMISVIFEEHIHNLRLFNIIWNNRGESQKNNELLDTYKDKSSLFTKGWLGIAATVDLSRNAVYNILDQPKEVRRDSVVLLGMALEMSIEEFENLYRYKGFVLRTGNARDEITREFFKAKDYDHIKWAKHLQDSGEEPPFNYKRPIK